MKKKDSARNIEDVRVALFNVHELQYNSTGDLKASLYDMLQKYECNDIVVVVVFVSFMTSRCVDSWLEYLAKKNESEPRW